MLFSPARPLKDFLNELKPNGTVRIETLDYMLDGERKYDGTFSGMVFAHGKDIRQQIDGATVEEFIERANQVVGEDLSNLDWEKYKSRRELKEEIAALREQCSRFFYSR